MDGPDGMPAARPVDAAAYAGDEERLHDRPRVRWLRGATAGAFVLVLVLTDLAPAVLAAGAVVAATTSVRERRGGVRWWTGLEVAGWALLVALVVALTPAGDGSTPVVLAVQLLLGVVAGAVLVVLTDAVTRAVRRRRAVPTAV